MFFFIPYAIAFVVMGLAIHIIEVRSRLSPIEAERESAVYRAYLKLRFALPVRLKYLLLEVRRAWWCRDPVYRDGLKFKCHYCGRPTASAPYDFKGKHWPSCCSGYDCVDKWKSTGEAA